MADLVTMEKIQPCLLDRLTDLNPTKKEESNHERVMSISRYRDGVLRDLRWLLSASQHGEKEDLQAYPQVRTSTLNYGIESLCGKLADSVPAESLEQQIADSICMFEPRISKQSLQVEFKADPENTSRRNEMIIEIRGDLWARPMPEEFMIKTKVDLETGDFKLI